MFKVERALTDDELKLLREVALRTLHSEEGQAAVDAYGLHVDDRAPILAMENIVNADRHNRDFAISDLWPKFVRVFLNSQNWELGFGFVGEASYVGKAS